MLRALRAEVWKLKRSTTPWWTALVVVLAPTMMVTAVESTAGATRVSWLTFMHMSTQVFVSWFGIILFGLVTAYLFGREYVEGTAKEMLSLPMRRECFLAAKATVLVVWVFGLTLLSLVAQAGYAAFLGLDGASWASATTCLGESLKATLLMSATLPVVALLAAKGRGYLAPMAFSAVMGTVGLAVAEAGWTRWFPWSMPIGLTGMGLFPAAPMQSLVPGSWVLAATAFVAGCAAVVWHVDTADSA